MTMLPSVDEDGYNEWQNQLYHETVDRKIHALDLNQAVNDRMANVDRIGALAAAPTSSDSLTNPLGTGNVVAPPPPSEPAAPEPAPTPEVPPAEAPPSPEPSLAAPPAPPGPVAPAAAAIAAPSAAPAASPDWETQVFGQALGAVSQAGGDVQAFADKFGSGLRGAPDVQSVFGQALGAASAAGADVQTFADRFQPPEKPAGPTPTAAPASGAPTPGGPLQDYARQAALRAGVDPDIFARQIQQESGFNPNARSPAGATGIAQIVPQYHPGVDPTDPYASLDYAANLMKSNLGKYGGDYAKALSAYNAGGGAVDRYGGVPPFEETQRYVNTILSGQAAGPRPTTAAEQALGQTGGWAQQAAQGRDISQFGDPQLTNDEAYAACGPSAAVRFAQRYGRNPSLREAVDLAKTVGWTTAQGMAGLSSEQALMTKMGVPTKLVNGADWGTFANEARTGNPVTISTTGHYFTADGWDPQTNRFHVGRSGLDLKGGSEWMTPEQMTAVMGPVQGGLLADNPKVASPSLADQDTNPASWLGRAKDSMVSSLTGDDSFLQRGIIGPLKGALSLESTPEVHDLDMKIASVGEPTPLEPGGPIGQAFSNLGSAAQGALQGAREGSGGTQFNPQAFEQSGITFPTNPLEMLGASNQGIVPTSGEDVDRARQEFIAQNNPLRDVPVVGPITSFAGQVATDPTNLLLWERPAAEVAGRAAQAAVDVAPAVGEAAQAALRSRQAAMAEANFASGGLGRLIPEPKTGEGMLASALDQLKGYPEEIAGPIREWASAANAPASSIALTVQRWVEQNPRAATRAQVLAPTTPTPELVSRVVEDLNAGLRTPARGASGGAAGVETGGVAGTARGDVYRPRGIGDLLDNGEPVSPGVGGVNLPNYVPDSVQRIIGRGWDEASSAAQAARTGTIEPGVLEDLAAAAKTTTDRAKAVLKLDDPANAKTAYVLKQAFEDQALRVRQAQLALQKAPDDLNATRDMVRAIAGQRALQETVAGVEPKAGRALDQFRYDQVLKDMASRSDMQPADYIAHLRDTVDFTDPANVADLAKKAFGYTFKDKAMAVWYFNLLSNPLTHIRNTLSNTIAGVTAPAEGAGAAALDPLARKLLGDTGPRQRYIQEVPAEYVGMLNSFGDASRQGLRRLATGLSDRAAGGTELRTGVTEMGGPISEALGGGLKNPINIPGRALAASDDFFRTMNEGGALHGLANRIARQEGHTGEALTDRIAELIKRPTEDMLDQAAKTGEYRVFQQANAWAQKVNNIRGDSALGRFILPFVKTPLNLMGYSLERSPIGALKILSDLRAEGPGFGSAGRAALRERGTGDLADRMSRATIGTTIFAGLAKYAWDGNLTGKTPSDPTERDAFLREGKEPYSFRNPRDGTWVSYLPLSPYSTIFGAAANVADAHRKGDIKNPDDIKALALGMGAAFADGLLDTQWTQQLSDALDIVNGKPQDLGDAINKFTTRQATSVNPGILRWVARATDDVLRDPQNPIEGLLSGNPFTQGQVRSELNAWGEPIRRPISGAEALVNPFNPSAATTDKVELELRRLEGSTGKPVYPVEPSLVGKDASVLGQDVQMTEEQQRHYQEMSGYLSKTLLDLLIGSDQYEKMSDPEKAKTIQAIYEKTRSGVRASMQPGMIEQAIEARVREAAAQAGVAKPTATPGEGTATPSPSPRSGGPVQSSGGPVRGGGVSSSGGPALSSGSPVPRP